MRFEFSDRLKSLPVYLFAEIDRQKQALRKKGVSLIDLSIGDPDILTPKKITEVLYKTAKLKVNQKYALDKGKLALRLAIKRWFKGRFNVTLDEDKEILPLVGSKEGLVHFPLGFVNPGDYVIIPSPGYPGYRGAAMFSGAKVYELALRQENDFLPDLESIPSSVRNKTRLIYLNYPNNPTTALASLGFLRELTKFCSKYGIILAYDNAYSEIYFKEKPRSVFEVRAAKEVALEFHSFSKTFCMTGFRIGWANGNSDLIKGLIKVKTNIDSGIFGAIQEAAIAAIEQCSDFPKNLRGIIKERREILVKILKESGYRQIHADSTFYVWTKIPSRFKSSLEFSKYLLKEKNIVATPGVGFGRFGDGFIRFALTVDKKIIARTSKLLGY